jgi:murein DD-endopeptidase MepM/ murein hydrolase activator NlpD
MVPALRLAALTRALSAAVALGLAGCGRQPAERSTEPDPPLPPPETATPVVTPPPVAIPSPPDVRRNGPAFSLPTENDALFRDEPGTFFMFVDRYKDGKTSQVWEGGSYGFVRNPRNTGRGEVFTKFHEGIDIAPVARDERGEPQDVVCSIADGTVVYCLKPPLTSNYGNYVVVAHSCGPKAGTFYSLYAHLRRIDTTPGSRLRRGSPLGQLGYTGAGIDRRRAHLHLEIALLLSERFDEHYIQQYRAPNGHGNFHGSNLIGIDAAAFLRAAHAEPGLTPADFLKPARPLWKALVPCRDGMELEIAARYPWLRKPGAPSASWEISLDGAGVPLAIAPSRTAVQFPAVSWVQPSDSPHSWATRNLLSGSGHAATLASEGSRYLQLLSGDF